MRLETTAGALKGALNILSRVVPRHATTPLVETVQFDGATVGGTDLDNYVEVKLAASRAEGEAAILLRPLAGLVKHIDRDDTITLRAGAQGATLTFSGGRYDLPTVEGGDLPPPNKASTPVPLDGESFMKGLRFCTRFISDELTRYYLHGICLDTDHMVATDGHRLAAHPIPRLETDFGKPIIHRATACLLSRLPAPTAIFIQSGNRPAMRFELPGVIITGKLIDGTFPDWRRVVPEIEPGGQTITVDRTRLIKVARRLTATMASGHTRAATLAYDSERLAICSASAPDQVLAREYVPDVAISGVNGAEHIEFNSLYLLDVLSAFPGDDFLTFFIRDANSPAIIRGGEGEKFIVLMPMRASVKELALQTLKEWPREKAAA